MALLTPDGYRAFDVATLRAWLGSQPALAERLGGSPDQWTISEVGDGNLNLVFLIDADNGSLCVKQSLPYVRAVGESWPMPLDRARFEVLHYQATGAHVDGLAPRFYHFDAPLYAMVLERLKPHIILRRGLVDGVRYPRAARDVAEFVARTAVLTSPLAEPFEQTFDRVAAFAANHAQTRITAELIFADPYRVLERNRWSSPQLDTTVASLRDDAPLRAAVAALGYRFLTRKEALLHGDLHTGSVMVTPDDTRVIDTEFSVYGPIGFDVGLFIANLLTAYFAWPAHARRLGLADAADYAGWLLGNVHRFWSHFASRYDALWLERANGDAYPRALFEDEAGAHAWADARQRAIRELFIDALGFAGAEIIRRIVGFAHNYEFESIEDGDLRASLEARAIALARTLIVDAQQYTSIDDIVAAAHRAAHATSIRSEALA